MEHNHERAFEVEPASTAENAAFLREIINTSLYGTNDRYDFDEIHEEFASSIPAIEKGYVANARHKYRDDESLTCKYDYRAMKSLIYGSPEKQHLASVRIATDMYDVYGWSGDDCDNPDETLLAQMVNLLENNVNGNEDIEKARQLDLAALPEDVNIEVYKNLPPDGWHLRSIGSMALEISRLMNKKLGVETDISVGEGMEALMKMAERKDTIKALEVDVAAHPVDSPTIRALTDAIREDYEPISYW